MSPKPIQPLRISQEIVTSSQCFLATNQTLLSNARHKPALSHEVTHLAVKRYCVNWSSVIVAFILT